MRSGHAISRADDPVMIEVSTEGSSVCMRQLLLLGDVEENTPLDLIAKHLMVFWRYAWPLGNRDWWQATQPGDVERRVLAGEEVYK